MSGFTNYLAKNGLDLSFIFQSGVSTSITGFYLLNGNDISSLFSPYTSGTQAPLTGLITQTGVDISTLFTARVSFMPLQIQGCCLWMDGADSTTITITSSKVSGWNDKSGQNYHFAQSTAANQPTYANNVITFTGANSTHLIGNNAATNFAMGTNSYSCFVVCSVIPLVGATANIYCKGRYANVPGRLFISRNPPSSGTLNARFSRDTNTVFGIDDTSYVSGTYRIIELILNRKVLKNDYIYVNGNLMRTTSNSADTNTSYSNNYLMLIGVGNDSTGTGVLTQTTEHLTGNVAEIVSYSNSTDMTDANRQKIEGYLAWKWSINTSLPLGHPYYSNPP